jgi:DNA-binding MarR family transcriptional regulator
MTVEPTGSSASPLRNLSDLVHQRSRLSILAALHEIGEAEFALLTKATGLSEGNLSRHIQILEDARLVRVKKGYVGRRPRTWVELTKAGRSAFEDEVRILRGLVVATEGAALSGTRMRARHRPTRSRDSVGAVIPELPLTGPRLLSHPLCEL